MKVMVDAVCYLLTGAMAGYWALWLAGCQLPGVEETPFRGWHHRERGPRAR